MQKATLLFLAKQVGQRAKLGQAGGNFALWGPGLFCQVKNSRILAHKLFRRAMFFRAPVDYYPETYQQRWSRILTRYTTLEPGMSFDHVEQHLGTPDQIHPLYEPHKYNPDRIGTSWFCNASDGMGHFLSLN